MCWRASSAYDSYGRTSARPGRSLSEWLRDLWRPRRPQVQEAEVVPFPAEPVVHAEHEPEPKRSRAA
jgi:hypothetical protein